MTSPAINQNFTPDDLYIKIGLEIHAQMKTKTKLFSRSLNSQSDTPNENINLFDIGVPGIFPKLNSKAVELAVITGLGLNCTINKISKFDRKHYQYADLPFGYQITQFFHPICSDGHLIIESGKSIGINRIHMECDAGKMIHTSKETLLDYNRAGIPLMEIVTEPDLSSSLEVEQFLKELILILEHIDTCDCNLELGNFRVDVNFSLNHKTSNEFGTRVEMKNLNSIKFIRDAIQFEFNRQFNEILNGTYNQNVIQETRCYDSDRKITYSMRKKETFMEYRYLPDGNIPPLNLSDEYINNIKKNMVALPNEKRNKYKEYLTKNVYDILINNQELGRLFDQYESRVVDKITFGNLLVGDLLGILNRYEKSIDPKYVEFTSVITGYLETNGITTKTAKLVLEKSILEDINPEEYIKSNDLCKITDRKIIEDLLKETISQKPKLWEEFVSGSEKLLMVFLGDIIKKTNGKADADITKQVIIESSLTYKNPDK